MISLLEVLRSTRAAWQLALGNAKAIGDFDSSPHGFWTSFWAVALIMPPLLLLDIFSDDRLHTSPVLIVLMLLAYTVDAVLFPVVMLALADRMGLWPRYPRYIVATNWAGIVQAALWCPIVLMLWDQKGSEAIVPLFLTFLLIQVYRFYIAKVALKITALPAAGLVLLQFLLSTAVQQVITPVLLMGPPPGAAP